MSEFENSDILEFDSQDSGVADEKPEKISHSAKPNLNLNKILKLAVPLVAIILVISIIVSIFSSSNEYFCYLKDGELFLSESIDDDGLQITQDFIIDGSVSGTNITDYIRMSDSGDKIFYIDKYDGSSRNLYYKNTDDAEGKAFKLSSDIDSYDINDKGTVVTYIKDDSDLFQHDLTAQSDKIDTDVTYFLSSNDGNKVLYYKQNTSDNVRTKDLYLYKDGKGSEKLATNVEYVRYVSDDFSKIYYVCDGVFYKLKVGKSPSKITDDVKEVVKVFDSGEAYYSKLNDKSVATLYYFDGDKESKAVVSNYYRTESIADDNTVLVVNCTENDKIVYKIVEESKVYKIDHDVLNISLNSDGSEVYFLADISSTNMSASLYYAEIDGKLENLNKVADGVSYGKYVSDDMYIYVKDYDYEAGSGDLYSHESVVAKDVYWNSMKYSEKNNILYFFTERKDNNGTLKCLKGGKVKEIKQDVRLDSLSITTDGDVLFLYDFKNGEGILLTYKGNKVKQLDHDVSGIVTIITNEQYDSLAKSYF